MWDKREKIGKIFTYIIFSLWSASEVLFNSTIETIFSIDASLLNQIIDYTILVLLMIQILLFQKYKLEELLLLVSITGLVSYVTLNSGHNKIMATWIFIVVAKNIDFEIVIRLIYVIEIIMTMLVVYLWAAGYISEYTMYRGYTLRHSLGFSHPNQLGIRIFLITICRSYIRKDRFNFFDWLIVIAASIFLYLVPNSQTSCLALIILAIIFMAYKLFDLLGVNVNILSDVYILVAIASNVCSIVFSFIDIRKYSILKLIDSVMSTRFSQCYRTMKYFGVKPWGQNIQLFFTKKSTNQIYHFWLDNAYVALLLRYGVVLFILFSSLYIYTMVMLKNKGQHYLVGILSLYAIYGMMENNFFSISQNIFLLLLSYPLFRRQDVERTVGKRIVINW